MTKIVMAIGKKLLNKNTPAMQKKCVSQTCYSFLQRSLTDEEYADKWSASADMDITEISNGIFYGGAGTNISDNLVRNYADMPVMSLSCPIIKDGEVVAALNEGATVNIHGTIDEWLVVSFGIIQGYVHNSNVFSFRRSA